MKSVLFVSHGSPAEQAGQEIEAIASKLRRCVDASFLETAFLEVNEPDIPTGIRRCVEKGATEVIVVLNFLNNGKHAGKQIPAMVEEARRQYPHVSFRITPCVGTHDKMIDVYMDLIQSAS